MSNLRDFLDILKGKGGLETIEEEVDPYLEATSILAARDGRTVLFNNVKGSGYRMVGGVCASRSNFATAFGIDEKDLLQHIAGAIDNPTKPEITEKGACQEVVEDVIDLSKLPVLTHSSTEKGPYITAGVYIANDPEYGTNASFHRTCVIGKDRLVARVCQRDLYKFLEKAGGELDIAICIGLHPAILLSAAVSAGTQANELEIANSLSPEPIKLVKCLTKDLYVPADAEIVIEGHITKERTEEGPFIDITGTLDHIRREPVIRVDAITHRKDPIYHALLPALSEHRLLMGMPREPVIYREVGKVCDCRDVILTHGGCSWLHAAVKIRKKDPEDGRNAIDAAFRGHASLKHVVVVDEDIDINDPRELEWAIATRSQAGCDVITRREKGSSLDPSCDADRMTWKAGIDATIPSGEDRDKYVKAALGK